MPAAEAQSLLLVQPPVLVPAVHTFAWQVWFVAQSLVLAHWTQVDDAVLQTLPDALPLQSALVEHPEVVPSATHASAVQT